MLLLTVSGWVNRHQQHVIEYLVEENRVLRVQTKGRPLRLIVRMAQVARNLTDAVEGFLRGHRFLICDRDSQFSAQFRRILREAGVDVTRTPLSPPNCNAHAERFVLSIKSECLRRMIFFGEASLRQAIAQYLDHYHTERAHQGLGNDNIEKNTVTPEGEIRCRERLGGILKHYYRAA